MNAHPKDVGRTPATVVLEDDRVTCVHVECSDGWVRTLQDGSHVAYPAHRVREVEYE